MPVVLYLRKRRYTKTYLIYGSKPTIRKRKNLIINLPNQLNRRNKRNGANEENEEKAELGENNNMLHNITDERSRRVSETTRVGIQT